MKFKGKKQFSAERFMLDVSSREKLDLNNDNNSPKVNLHRLRLLRCKLRCPLGHRSRPFEH